ncbi:MAG: copper resistance D family protein [Maricaulaceae bacterium]
MSLNVLATFMLLAKLCLYAGALISIGVITHALLKIRENLKGLFLGIGLLSFGLAAKLLATNAQMAGGLSQALNLETFYWVWQSSSAQTGFVVSAVLLVLTALALKTYRLSAALLVAGVLCLSASFAMSGHTRGQENAPWLYLWMIPHLLFAGFWVMAPISLWPERETNDHTLIQKVEGFSRAAIWLMPILFGSGAYMLWKLLPELSDLWTTRYGLLLSTKLFAVTGLLGLGAWNKLSVTQTLKDDAKMGRAQLRRSLSLEAMLFVIAIVVILFATTVTGPTGHSH